jgi:hypothetical protein
MVTCSWSQGNVALLLLFIFFCLATHLIFFTHALYVHRPMYLRGYMPFSIANFGIPHVTSECECFPVVEADPEDACSTLHDQYHNKIVFVRRGNCSFVKKALFVEESGAVGMLLWNNEDQEQSPHITITGEQQKLIQRLLADKSISSSGTLQVLSYPSDSGKMDIEITKDILEQLKTTSNAVSISIEIILESSYKVPILNHYPFKFNIYSYQ